MNDISNGKANDSSELLKIIHIPGKPPVCPHLLDTVDVLASAIDPKNANTVVRKLNRIAPLEGLRHVKRVRKTCLDGGKTQLSVILCMDFGNDGEPNYIPEVVLELINTFQLSIFTTKVCKYAAVTKEEWIEQCKLWPTSFHPPIYNIDGITGFSGEDSLSVFNFMKLAIGIAKSDTLVVNAAVIVDPLTRQVIASSSDQVLSCCALTNSTNKDESAIEHDANIVQKDRISLSKSSFNVTIHSSKNVACLHSRGWLEKHPHLNINYVHPLRHAGIVAIENSAARDRRLFPINGQNAESDQKSGVRSSPTGTSLKRQKIEDDENGLGCDSTRPYLCTGYDIYLVWEPCTMCSMAIVHQRIRRVFYAFPNPNDGALGSVHRLQGERSLNHHYAVFRVLLDEEILDTEA